MDFGGVGKDDALHHAKNCHFVSASVHAAAMVGNIVFILSTFAHLLRFNQTGLNSHREVSWV